MGSNHCDVFIAGAGPAGLAAAIALRLRGADVLLADAAHPPIDKACGEGLMPPAIRALAALGVFPEEAGLPFSGIAFADDRARVSAEFPALNGSGIRRTRLHRILLDRAATLGVRFAFDSPVLLRGNGHPILAGRSGSTEIHSRWIVGADGASSRVRSWAGLERPLPRARRFGFRTHFRLGPGIPPPTHVEVHWSRAGQVYITPTALHEGRAEICISAMTRDSHTRLVHLLADLPSVSGMLHGAESISSERGCQTLNRSLPRVTRSRIALIGDASGSVDAITGEGLALAFRQAAALADSLAAGTLELYESRHPALAALPLRMARLLLLLDRHPQLRARTLRAFAAHPALFAALLAVHVGEQPLSHFLLRHGPVLGLRLLADSP